MGKYGEAALKAIQYCNTYDTYTPVQAWNRATIELFGEGSSSQVKGCPKNAFLGLCEVGLIKGIQKGRYSKSQKNKAYAIQAVKAIQLNPSAIHNSNALWLNVTNNSGISHNGQLDVVIALWKDNLLISTGVS
jgi:hypothetical protein